MNYTDLFQYFEKDNYFITDTKIYDIPANIIIFVDPDKTRYELNVCILFQKLSYIFESLDKLIEFYSKFEKNHTYLLQHKDSFSLPFIQEQINKYKSYSIEYDYYSRHISKLPKLFYDESDEYCDNRYYIHIIKDNNDKYVLRIGTSDISKFDYLISVFHTLDTFNENYVVEYDEYRKENIFVSLDSYNKKKLLAKKYFN